MSAKTFIVELERVQRTATMFHVPFDLGGAFGRARPPVKVTIRVATTIERVATGKAQR